MYLNDEAEAVKQGCERSLCRHLFETPRDLMQRLSIMPEALLPSDAYGEGALIQKLEREVAALLGKEAGLFMTRGIAAQQIALRLWTKETGRNIVALHPKSHMRIDEYEAPVRLNPIVERPVGRDHTAFGTVDLDLLLEKPGVVSVELPLRRAGYRLPGYENLASISAWCQRHEVPLHFDGARLWESAIYYRRSLEEIAALADTVYVSLYKGLGGLGGCVLAGPKEFIDEARLWRARYGAILPTNLPLVLSGLDGVQRRLAEIPSYVARAREIAEELRRVEGVTIAADMPQMNGFHIYLAGAASELKARHLAYAAETGVWFFNTIDPSQVPGIAMAEIEVQSAASQVETSEILDCVRYMIGTDRLAGDEAGHGSSERIAI